MVAGSYTGSVTCAASVAAPATAMAWRAAGPRAAVAKSKRTSARPPAGTVTRRPAGPVAVRLAARTATSITRGARSRFCTTTGSEKRSPMVRKRGATTRALSLRCVTTVPSALPNQRVWAVASATTRKRVRLSGMVTVRRALPSAPVRRVGENTAVARKSLRASTTLLPAPWPTVP